MTACKNSDYDKLMRKNDRCHGRVFFIFVKKYYIYGKHQINLTFTI